MSCWRLLACLAALGACKHPRERPHVAPSEAPPAEAPSAEAPALPSSAKEGAPRTGMVWVAPGRLIAGTPRGRVPRIANEEPAGEPVDMTGFYIDILPYPNEPGAIATSNVTRDDAVALCEQRQKRLCSELEWERACKGPDNGTYDYGDVYRSAACGTGVEIERSACRPSGENPLCKTGFGALDMHGGVWEWTSSPWGRGRHDPTLGALRGGNAVAGELVGRCANALGRPTDKRSPTMGFRCCAGAVSGIEVHIALEGVPALRPVTRLGDLEAALEGFVESQVPPSRLSRAWRWVPVENEELSVILLCQREAPHPCTLSAIRLELSEGAARVEPVVASVEAGTLLPNVVQLGDARHIRLRGLDSRGTFGRDLTYVYGRVAVDVVTRP